MLAAPRLLHRHIVVVCGHKSDRSHQKMNRWSKLCPLLVAPAEDSPACFDESILWAVVDETSHRAEVPVGLQAEVDELVPENVEDEKMEVAHLHIDIAAKKKKVDVRRVYSFHLDMDKTWRSLLSHQLARALL